MAFGFRVVGDAGNVQVDDVSPTLVFLAKGSITLDQRQTSGSENPVLDAAYLNGANQAASAGGGLLCAFRARFTDRPVGIWERSDSQTRFVGYSSIAGLPPVVDWWMFGRVQSAPQWGLVVYDDAGQRTWASNGRPMKVAAAKSDVPVSVNAIHAPVAGDYALAVGLPLGGVVSGTETPSGGGFVWLEGRPMWFPPSSTGFGAPTVMPARRLSDPNYPTGWRTNDIRASMLLIDVAGL